MQKDILDYNVNIDGQLIIGGCIPRGRSDRLVFGEFNNPYMRIEDIENNNNFFYYVEFLIQAAEQEFKNVFRGPTLKFSYEKFDIVNKERYLFEVGYKIAGDEKFFGLDFNYGVQTSFDFMSILPKVIFFNNLRYKKLTLELNAGIAPNILDLSQNYYLNNGTNKPNYFYGIKFFLTDEKGRNIIEGEYSKNFFGLNSEFFRLGIFYRIPLLKKLE
ncbi:MAG: hypothetical protein NC918_00350 [Candidatus Omnitrophica bacterium]|nr:hypothetical protein [Candidatus Omnitrophota bacterium]